MKREAEIRERLARYCHRLYDCGHVVARDGNMSVKVGQHIWITPTGKCKKDIQPKDFVVMDLNGNILGSGCPSSEVALHFLLYGRYPAIGAICHAHPFYATLATLHKDTLDPTLLAESRMHLTQIAYVEDLAPGSLALTEAVQSVLSDGLQALILRRHGTFTWGSDIDTAYYQTESLERLARTSFYDRFVSLPFNTL